MTDRIEHSKLDLTKRGYQLDENVMSGRWSGNSERMVIELIFLLITISTGTQISELMIEFLLNAQQWPSPPNNTQDLAFH